MIGRDRKFGMHFYQLYQSGLKRIDATELMVELKWGKGYKGRRRFVRRTKESDGYAVWIR